MTSERHLTALDLDLLELDPAPQVGGTGFDRRGRDAHAAGCGACAARREEHRQLRRRFEAEVFARTVARVNHGGARALAARVPRWTWTWGLAVPALAAALFVWTRGPGRRDDRAGPAGAVDVAVKGGLFEAYVRRSGGGAAADGAAVARLVEGERLRPGDALRFVVYPAGLPYVLIASVDGAGQISVYFPFHGEGSAPVAARGPYVVPASIVLDQAPGPERLFAIYSRRPVEARAVRDAAAQLVAGGASAIRAGRRLTLDDTVQATLLFEKESTP
jgi:hypothetical protein